MSFGRLGKHFSEQTPRIEIIVFRIYNSTYYNDNNDDAFLSL